MKFYKHIYVVLVLLFIGCKQNKNLTIINNEEVINYDTLANELPIGSKLLFYNLNDSIKSKGNFLKKVFHYYDSINKVENFNLKQIKTSKYGSFYKPNEADNLNEDDRFALQSINEYSFFDLVKMFNLENDFKAMIFKGGSSVYDYDGNVVLIDRKDLVVINKNEEIISEMNLYYDFSDGITAKTKFFYIDKNYNIYIKYYYEGEEKSRFSNIEKYKILVNGVISKQKKVK
ncbi:hypothetical protein A8C32_09925 [Flavivirga aquatica]|uniref:Lipoprotein n=1 Tax=Flavivirga aquatica TaxID=1849968 RepID=A0A1E5TEM5_9FLAO|nr:hypothetical protein [Flavivirga aquatica]OEK09819.1 hypothetical protein A8C32_09925 [Flavivirga aquatica]